MAASRKYLGADIGYGLRLRVFLRADAVEVEEANFSEIERRRVYFDDVLLLTYHRSRWSAGVIILTVVLVLVGLCLGAALSSKEQEAVIGFGVWMGLLFLVWLIRILLGIDVITVYGRRTMARVKFFWRKGRARRVYAELAEKIEAHQVQAARARAAAAPKPPPPPAPPSLGSMELPPPPTA